MYVGFWFNTSNYINNIIWRARVSLHEKPYPNI